MDRTTRGQKLPFVDRWVAVDISLAVITFSLALIERKYTNRKMTETNPNAGLF